jgi:hypothetical protein
MFALPVLILVALAFVELVGLVQSRSAMAHLTAAGGRAAVIAAADPMADRTILNRMAAETAGLDPSAIEYVVVWHARDPGDPVPPGCVPEALPSEPNAASEGIWDQGVDALGACNVYLLPAASGGAFAKARGDGELDPTAFFGCEGPDDPAGAAKLDCSWPGKNRRAVTSPRDFLGTAAPPDFVGVHVHVRHTFHTSVLFGEMSLASSSIGLIEPYGYEL